MIFERLSRRGYLNAIPFGIVSTTNIFDELNPQSSAHTLTIEGAQKATYELGVSGELAKSRAMGASINKSDTLSGSMATGEVNGGRDSYEFSGEITRLVLNGGAFLYYDDKRVDPSQYLPNTLTIEGSASYRITTSAGIVKSRTMRASVDNGDTITGLDATGRVGGSRDSYAYCGRITDLSVDGDVQLYLNGTAIDPAEILRNVLTITGSGSRANYTFTVKGGVVKSAANDATFNDGDTVSGSIVRGDVSGGTDSYAFGGRLRSLDITGDATATLNGRERSRKLPPLIGVYSGIGQSDFETISHMEDWQNTRYGVQNLFIPWNPESGHMNWLFGTVLPQIWDAGRVPLITWEPFTPGASAASVDSAAVAERTDYAAFIEGYADTTSNDIEVRIANGEYDSYIDEWAERLQTWIAGPDEEFGTSDDRRAYLRLAHEMNGNWYPWSPAKGGNTPADYIKMWKHIWNRLDRKELTGNQVQWMWCVNHNDIGPAKAEQMYPGTAYVDWVGIDGYNWGDSQPWSNWQSPQDVFGEMISRLRALSDKPLCVTEFASSSMTDVGTDPSRKDEWIRSAFDYFANNGVEMRCCFNEEKETDWRIFDGERGTETVSFGGSPINAYAEYRKTVDARAWSDPKR